MQITITLNLEDGSLSITDVAAIKAANPKLAEAFLMEAADALHVFACELFPVDANAPV